MQIYFGGFQARHVFYRTDADLDTMRVNSAGQGRDVYISALPPSLKGVEGNIAETDNLHREIAEFADAIQNAIGNHRIKEKDSVLAFLESQAVPRHFSEQITLAAYDFREALMQTAASHPSDPSVTVEARDIQPLGKFTRQLAGLEDDPLKFARTLLRATGVPGHPGTLTVLLKALGATEEEAITVQKAALELKNAIETAFRYRGIGTKAVPLASIPNWVRESMASWRPDEFGSWWPPGPGDDEAFVKPPD